MSAPITISSLRYSRMRSWRAVVAIHCVPHRREIEMQRPRVDTGACRRIAFLIALAAVVGPDRGAWAAPDATSAPSYRLEPVPSGALRFIAYGDMRFTATSEQEASSPTARQALVKQVAAEAPIAVFLNGDVPWHGGNVADYEVFKNETAIWRERG